MKIRSRLESCQAKFLNKFFESLIAKEKYHPPSPSREEVEREESKVRRGGYSLITDLIETFKPEDFSGLCRGGWLDAELFGNSDDLGHQFGIVLSRDALVQP